MSDESAGGKVVHVKKFLDGQASPQEVHRALAWGGRKCDKCGNPATVRVRIFADAKEVMARSPQFVMQLARSNEGSVPVVDFKTGKFIRVSEAFACSGCRKDLEQEAAKAPSWCCCEIDTGPEEKVQVGHG